MSNYSFKPLGNNKYEMLYNGASFGITFITPDEYSMDDYKNSINFSEVKDLKACKDVVIRLKNEPEKTRIKISSHAGVTFEGGLSFCVNNSITLAKNKNLLFCAKDGVKEVVVDNLMVKKNKSSSFTFYPTPEGATTRDDKRLKGKDYPLDATFRDNKNIDLKLQDQFMLLHIESLTSKEPYSITLDCISGAFVISSGTSFTPKVYDSALKFKADRIEFSYTAFKDEVKLNTERDAKISGQNSLESVVITCQYESIHLDSNGEIKDSQIEFCTEQGASTYGRTIKGSKFANAKMTNIIHDLSLFVDKAGVEYTSLVCDKIQMNNSSSSGSLIKFIASNSSEAEAKTKIPIYLENIKLDSHACLEVNLSNDLSKKANIPIEFKNTDFNQYNAFEIDGALSVENSSFKNLRFISSLDNKESVQKIENSICRDVIRLHNISKLSFSEINNTDISNNKEVEVSNEFIKDQRIGNYEDFAKNSQTRANFDRDSRITEDLEVL